MSMELLESVRQFVDGNVSAEIFADSFMERWKRERDTGITFKDCDRLSECLSTVFCLADLYNPASGRATYELDDARLREEIGKCITRLKLWS